MGSILYSKYRFVRAIAKLVGDLAFVIFAVVFSFHTALHDSVVIKIDIDGTFTDCGKVVF